MKRKTSSRINFLKNINKMTT